MRSLTAIACAAVLALIAACPATAVAQAPATAFAADASQTGVISLYFWGANGGRVEFFEKVGDERKRLGIATSAAGMVTTLKDATTWSCDRLERTFTARATLPDGTVARGEYGVRTVSCAKRFTVDAPAHVDAGDKAKVRVVDRWRIGGIRPKLCVRPPESRTECRRLAFPKAVSVSTRDLRLRARGRWRVELRVRSFTVRSSIRVGGEKVKPPKAPPTVLATGDSTMQGIDSFLADELVDDATVRSDVQIGTGISRGIYWTNHAEQQVLRYRPRVTVISIGAALDAFPLPVPGGGTADCCEEPWIAAYSARVRDMMQTYLRLGRGRVFWLTPPLPSDPDRLRITTAIDIAILRAAEGLEGVKVIRVDQLFAPSGRYQEVIRYRGRDVRVRDEDGVHLNISGTSIMAQILAPAVAEALEELVPKQR